MTAERFTTDISEIPEFAMFRKIPRLRREIVVTEKIDGTNAQLYITEEGAMWVGSRKRWITPAADNFGFAKWAYSHKEELLQLGPGHHYGEWWGQGIQRKYGLDHKVFSLFNTYRWCKSNPQRIEPRNPQDFEPKYQQIVPECCDVVPVLWKGIWNDYFIGHALMKLAENGSKAAPGFMDPEGIVIYHDQGKLYFKQTLQGDEVPKGMLNGTEMRALEYENA
jgi:hypothetical protein